MTMNQLSRLALVAALFMFPAACGTADDAPPATDPPEAEEVAPAPDEPGSIVAVAAAAGNFETLIAAASAAGLAETLDTGGPFTVFAPTDEAFAALPEGTLEGLLADPEALSQILLYHVVAGEVRAAQVVDMESAETLQGGQLSIMVHDDMVMVNNATVIATDIEASNGVIHVIDTVLIPGGN